MKNAILTLLFVLKCICLSGQELNTTGDNSPAVIAQNFSVTYGVRADAVEAILWIYKAEGYDEARRKRATEQILREYAQSPEKKQKSPALSDDTRRKMGINDAPKVANALEWDLFAGTHYLSTSGSNSPAVVAKGDVNIWYGIPPKALRALATQLEQNKTDASNFEAKLADQVQKYEELKSELETYGSQEKIYLTAEALLEEGKLEEAERLIESDFDASMKRQAYKGFIYGKTKELLLKYEEAAKGFKNAVNNDEGNSNYHKYYADNQETLAHFDESIKHLEIALGIDSLKTGNDNKISTIYNSLGSVWHEKGEYDKAIEYYEKALQLCRKALGDNHYEVAFIYNNISLTWNVKGAYDKAIEYCEKALQINLKALGEDHVEVATNYSNLGAVYLTIGEYDIAIDYYEKALQNRLKVLDKNHPSLAIIYSNLGEAWYSKFEYDIATDYYEKALQIDLKTFGENYPGVAIGYSHLGLIHGSKGELDKAIEYFEKALQIDLKIFGEVHNSVATRYNNLGTIWKKKKDYDKAVACYEKALKILLEVFGEEHPNVGVTYYNIGLVLYSKGAYDESNEYNKKALQIHLKIFGENHPNIAAEYYSFARWLYSKTEYDSAIVNYEKSLSIMENFMEPGRPFLTDITGSISRAAHKRGMELSSEKKHTEALEYYEKALRNAQNAGTDPTTLSLIRTIQYNKIGSLKALEKTQEAEALARQLWQEGNEANDTRLLEDLKKEGYDFGKN